MSNIAPTKTNLLKLKSELKFARLGYDLLDQKRNILVLELLNLVDQTIDMEGKVETALAEAYRNLEEASVAMGKLEVLSLQSAINIETQISIRQRKIMGVRLPVVETTYSERPPFYSPMGTSAWIDSALVAFKTALELMGRFAELKVSIMRLAREVKKTIRKVNALEKIAIPDLEENVRSIQSRLEESERDAFVLMKMVKSRLEGRAAERQA
jgi:V/A-type H+-transporting ATPase subunit D